MYLDKNEQFCCHIASKTFHTMSTFDYNSWNIDSWNLERCISYINDPRFSETVIKDRSTIHIDRYNKIINDDIYML